MQSHFKSRPLSTETDDAYLRGVTFVLLPTHTYKQMELLAKDYQSQSAHPSAMSEGLASATYINGGFQQDLEQPAPSGAELVLCDTCETLLSQLEIEKRFGRRGRREEQYSEELFATQYRCSS